jgi:hypothetical protein
MDNLVTFIARATDSMLLVSQHHALLFKKRV